MRPARGKALAQVARRAPKGVNALVGVADGEEPGPGLPGKAQHGLELQQRKILGLVHQQGGEGRGEAGLADRGQQEFQQVREIGLVAQGLGLAHQRPGGGNPRRGRP